MQLVGVQNPLSLPLKHFVYLGLLLALSPWACSTAYELHLATGYCGCAVVHFLWKH